MNACVALVVKAGDKEVRLIAHTLKELGELLVGHAGEDGGVGDLVAVEVQDRQNDTVGCRVHELVGLPRGGKRAGLGLAVAHHGNGQQARVVHNGAVGVAERIAELATLVDGAGRLGRKVARNAAGIGELAEELLQAGLVIGDVGVYWHWSPYNGWAMNHQIKGHNECHIIYILGASSPTYPIAESVYHKGWVNANTFLNGREYYGIKLPLGNDNGKGGPLFFTHYSYMGLDPHGLKDRYADYEEQMKAHTLINRAYCIDNPKGYKGYGEKCWGLTASDGDKGYSAHSPGNDRGVITPTAALSSIPYTPEYSLEAMRYFYEELGDRLWGEYGFKDAFNLTEDWFAPSYLAIDQGPIIVMIENYRTGLIWKLFMSHPDVQKGLKRLGFTSPYLNKAD